MAWVAETRRAYIPTLLIVWVLGAFFLLHYLFASVTAHVSALFQIFLVVAIAIPGISRAGWTLLLCYSLGLMGILTPYGTGPSPIYYGCGYIKGKDFWILGFLLGLLFFAAYILIELPWLAFLKL